MIEENEKNILNIIFLASAILLSKCNYLKFKILDRNGRKLGEKIQSICFYKDFNIILIKEKYKIEKEILSSEIYIYHKLKKIENIKNYFIKQHLDIDVPIKILIFIKNKWKKELNIYA